MDNLWLYLILIFGYVGYSLVKSASKQRDHAQEGDDREARRGDDESPRSLEELWQQLVGITPPPVPEREERPRESRRSEPEKPAVGTQAGHKPFLADELAGAMAPAAEARESFRRKVEGEMPETAALREERAATACEKPAAPAAPSCDGEAAPLTTPEEWRRAFIVSEIWNRKY